MTKKSSLKVLCVLVLAVALVFALGSTALAASTDPEQVYVAGDTANLQFNGVAGTTYYWTAALGNLGTNAVSGSVVANAYGVVNFGFTTVLPAGATNMRTETIKFFTDKACTTPVEVASNPLEFKVSVYPKPVITKIDVTGSYSGATTYTGNSATLNLIQGESVTIKVTGTFGAIKANISNAGEFASPIFGTSWAPSGTDSFTATVVANASGKLLIEFIPQVVIEVVDSPDITLDGSKVSMTFTTATGVFPYDLNVPEKIELKAGTNNPLASLASYVALAGQTVNVNYPINVEVPSFLTKVGTQDLYYAAVGEGKVVYTGTVATIGGVYSGKGTVVSYNGNLALIKYEVPVVVTAAGPTDPVDPVDPVDPPDTGDAFPIWIALLGVAAIAAGTFAVKKVRA